MTRNEMLDLLGDNPIIAAVSNRELLEDAVNSSPCNVIFILYGDIMGLKDDVDYVLNHNKLVFVHIDLVQGLAHDLHALEYIKKVIGPSGIITTKANLVRKAKELDMTVVQRLFMLDSKSFSDGINSMKKNRPDAIEIMPGLVTKIIKRIDQMTGFPIIAGGLIDKKEEIIEILSAGASSVSTSNKELWEC